MSIDMPNKPDPKVVVVIQARLSSSRLPGKALLLLAGYPAVVLCALRAANTGRSVIIATSSEPSDDAIASVSAAQNIACFRGPLNDVLARVTMAVDSFSENDIVVRLTADNVFPDGKFIDALVEEFNASAVEYMGTHSPDDGLPYGMSAEVFTVKLLRDANRNANNVFDREHVTPYIRRTAFAGLFTVENSLPDWPRLRCTLDDLNDYISLLKVFDGVESPLSIPWVTLIAKLQEVTPLPEHMCPSKNNSDGICRSELVLGTVQFGLPYGIANQNLGMPAECDVLEIIEYAAKAGINVLDTARVYGNAEHRIGKALASSLDGKMQVITKLDPLDYLTSDSSSALVRSAVRSSVYQSCYELGLKKLDVLLLHRWEHQYKWNGAVWDELHDLRDKGVIGKLGASVSTPEEASLALSHSSVAVMQCPVNILDWRWRAPSFVSMMLGRSDVVVHARSAYLQGLLLMPEDQCPVLAGVDMSAVNRKLDNMAINFGRLNRKDLCLAYVRSQPWVSSVVLGVISTEQLFENIALMRYGPLRLDQLAEIEATFSDLPEGLLNPASWNK